MQNNEKVMSPTEVIQLSNELTYQEYLFTKDHVQKLLKELNRPEYIALHIIREMEDKSDIYSGRTYLKELADKMKLPIRKVSNMVGPLKERGLLTWSHDGDGSEGTYVTITDSGKNLLKEEEIHLKDFYGKIIKKFGKENLTQMLRLMKQLETIVSAEIEAHEEDADEAAYE